MNSTATAARVSASRLAPALLAAFIGIGIVFVTGIVQTPTLHAAAHDVRHSTGFPCH